MLIACSLIVWDNALDILGLNGFLMTLVCSIDQQMELSLLIDDCFTMNETILDCSLVEDLLPKITVDDVMIGSSTVFLIEGIIGRHIVG